jgi:hypothetical protein
MVDPDTCWVAISVTLNFSGEDMSNDDDLDALRVCVIDVNDDVDVGLWALVLHVTSPDVREAVLAVGNLPGHVQHHLQTHTRVLPHPLRQLAQLGDDEPLQGVRRP